jgi:PAS domain S-box-containing protein
MRNTPFFKWPIFCFQLLIFIVMILVSQHLSFANSDHSSKLILQSASELDYPPFALVRPDGTADGFSVDLLKAVAHAADYQVNIAVGPWAQIKEQLAQGQLDVLPLVSYSAQRDKVYDFTVPYLQMRGAVFVRQGETTIHHLGDLQGKEVIVMRGDTAHEYALSEKLSDQLILVDSFEEAMVLLASGKHDAVLCQYLMGLQLIKQLGLRNIISVSSKNEVNLKFKTSKTSGFEQKFCIAVPEGSMDLQADLNEGLAIVIANGTFDELYQKWFGPILPKPTVPFLTVVKSVLVILVPLLLVLAIVGMWYLKREVRQKTSVLQGEINERKRVEQQLRLNEKKYKQMFLDNKAIKLLINPVDGAIVEANGAACEFYQYSQDELLNLTITDINTLPHHKIFAEMEFALHQGRNHCNFLHKISTGEIKNVEVYPGSITGADGTSLIFSIIHDVSARKKLEDRLQQAQKMEAIGTLAGGIAHDFNNILGVILGYADMAKEDAPPGTQFSKDLDEILRAAHRAKDLVSQILTFSRQTEVERIPLQIQPLVQEGLKMLRSSIPSSISIVEDIDPQAGVVMADPTQVYQILMNLCTNAYQAMGDTGGTLSVSVHMTTITADNLSTIQLTPGEYLEIIVADTGVGIGADIISKIFDPYFTTKEVGKGTGMGLAIIHGIMSEYGGAITVDSVEGDGSNFHVYFPLVDHEIQEDIKKSKEVCRGSERVLFIDDEKFLLEMGKSMLERLGYQVTSCQSSLGALKIFQNNPSGFDLVITDQTMPEMAGADLARNMLEVRPDIPIILCTGYSSMINEKSAKALGIKEFILKPITSDLIAKIIRKVLDGEA